MKVTHRRRCTMRPLRPPAGSAGRSAGVRAGLNIRMPSGDVPGVMSNRDGACPGAPDAVAARF